MPRARTLAACLAAVALGPGVASARAAATVHDPAANRPLSSATLTACHADPAGPACVSSALADINAARAAEGVAPMVLPSDFSALSVPLQLLVVSDLERTARGLIPALGLAAPLDADAAAAAAADVDPTPTHWYGDEFASNWAGGYDSALEADFGWMYDDGPGSDNIDCTATHTSGCWGHRHDILLAYDAPLVMGAAAGTGQYGTSLTELFVGGDTEASAGHPDAPLGPTWATLTGAAPPAATPATPTPTAHPTATRKQSRPHHRHRHRRRSRTRSASGRSSRAAARSRAARAR